ncbi:FecR family protein [Salinimicrobium gaetbulicola]|uniref:FecR family protein n=1 Tax=Salinimicrobium gaetbulicola TaxID=999702 RepID=A0ABW3IH97_9FLAO
MENKDLISKWLNNELTARELEAFKQTADYQRYSDIVENAARFHRPHFNEEQGLLDLKERLASKKEVPVRKLNFSAYYKVAAVFIVFLATGLFIWLNQPEVISTGYAEMAVLELPDQSTARLNADSKIKYKPSKWDKKRILELEGEAYFQVEKGKKFTVETDQGEVTVLGTKFNVKDRENYFEVHCYEGAVKVNVANKEIILRKGNSIKVINGEVKNLNNFDRNAPGWTIQESDFNAVPLKQVIAELERQFDLDIETEQVDLNQLFTGSFSHTNKEVAIQAISIPLQLNYKFESEKKVILYVE